MDKTKQLALLTVIAIVAVLAGGWFLLVSPQRSDAKDVRAQATSQEQANQSLQQKIASLQAQHKDLPQVQAQLAKLGTQLPSNPQLPALIRQLSAAADNAGVSLLAITPSVPVLVVPTTTKPATPTTAADNAANSTSEPSTPTAGAAAPAGGSQLAAVPVDVQVAGGYFQLEQFVSNLEALKRSFLSSGIDLCAAQATNDSQVTCVDTLQDPAAFAGVSLATVHGRVFMNVKTAAPATPVAPTAAK